MISDTIPDEALVHEATLPVLGVPVRLLSNASEVIDAFEDSLGYWRILESRADLIACGGVEGRLVVRPGDEGGHVHAPVAYRKVDWARLLVSTPGSVCLSDVERREFAGWVTTEVVRDRDHFRYNILEALIFSILSWLNRLPLHAAAVVRNGAVLLLTGPSGTGKSTLTYAAARSGLQVLTDDIVYAQLDPMRVWGMPNFLHLPISARRHFPELADVAIRLLANGKEKLSLSLAEMGARAPLPVAERFGICVLERSDHGGVGWEPLSRLDLERALLQELEPGFDVFRDNMAELVHAMVEGGGWRLRLGGHPLDAVEALHALFDEVEASVGNAPRDG